MKIIVMDSANVRIEVLNVADHLLEDDTELFLAKHGYSLNNISWMAAPIDYVPVQFYEYDTDHEDVEEVHTMRNARLKDFSVYESVQEVKHREQEELVTALHRYGEKVDGGYEWHFEDGCPIVAAYDYDEPCDVVILAARVDKVGHLTILGDEKNDRGIAQEYSQADA